MGKRRKEGEHTEGYEYNLPVPKSRKTGRDSVAFKPNDQDFRALLDKAFESKLKEIIKSGLKQYSKSNVVELKNKKANRKKVPPGTYESLDIEYGSYWTANTAKRLKLNTFDLYMTYFQTRFDILLKLVQEASKNEPLPEEQQKVVQLDEETRAIVVPLNQVLRRDLPPDMRAAITKKFSAALSQYSDFACIFSFIVEMTMKNFALSKNNNSIKIDSIVPTEFQIDVSPISLPTLPKYPTSDDITYADYKNLFSCTHLQVVSTLNFGITGVQNQKKKKSSLVDKNAKVCGN